MKYDWKDTPVIDEYLTDLYKNTIINLKNNNNDLKYANKFINYIEDFIICMINSNLNYCKIFNSIKEIESIGFFDEDYQNIHQLLPVKNLGNQILLNNNIKDSEKLTKDERERLYLYKGLAHSIFNLKNKKTLEFSKLFTDVLRTNQNKTAIIINNGWTLIEEVLTQEFAERVTYTILKKKRPGIRPGNEPLDPYPITGLLIGSSLEMNRPFEEVLILFGGAISNVGTMYNHSREIIKYDIIKKAINNSLSDSVISEFIKKNREVDLYLILYLMGILINEKYITYRLNFIKNLYLEEQEVELIYINLLRKLSNMVSLDNKEYKDIPIRKKQLTKHSKKRIRKVIENGDYEI